MTQLLRSPEAPRRKEELSRLDGLTERFPVHGWVVGRQLAADGTVSADVAVDVVRSVGMDEATVRICVRLAGLPGRAATVSIVDIPCDPRLDPDISGTSGSGINVVPFNS